MTLADFVASTRGDAFAWGRNDCALWCADAVRHGTGQDPAADLRGRYGTRFECLRLLKWGGGLRKVVEQRMARIDMLRPLDGDGVALAEHQRQEICGVIIDGGLIMRTECGLRVAHRGEYRLLRGWSWSRP